MKELYGETILPEFDKYSYTREGGSKPELILFWIHHYIAIFKEGMNIMLNSLKPNVNNID